MKMLCYVTSGLSEPPALYLLLSDRRSPPAIPNMVSTIALACYLLRENKACYMLHVTRQKISNMVSTIACYLLKEKKGMLHAAYYTSKKYQTWSVQYMLSFERK